MFANLKVFFELYYRRLDLLYKTVHITGLVILILKKTKKEETKFFFFLYHEIVCYILSPIGSKHLTSDIFIP